MTDREKIKKPFVLLVTVALLGWLFDFLFWKQQLPAINFTIYVNVCLAASLAWLIFEGKVPKLYSHVLYPVIGLLAVVASVRLEPLTVFLTVVFSLGFSAIFVISYPGKNWLRFGVVDYIINIIHLMASFFAGGLIYLMEARAAWKGREAGGERFRKFWPIFRGLLLALPILALLTALLISADLVFSQRMENLVNAFHLESIPEYLFRTFYVSVLALFLAGTLLHSAGSSPVESIEIQKPAAPKPFLGFTETMIVLGSVALLFAAFVTIQLQYFFGGEKNIDIAGYTYAEYARRGFGELIAVAVIVLLLLLGLGLASRRESPRQRLAFAAMGAVVAGMVLVMLASAYQRLTLYEAAYGFTRDRTFTHVFMIWLAALLVAVIVLEASQRPQRFLLLATLAALGFTATLSIMNVDGFIAHRNVQRAVDGEKLDAVYLEALTDDAVPTLANEFLSAGATPLKDQLGEVLAHIDCARTRQAKDSSWKSFHFSHHQADEALDSIRPELERYRATAPC